MKEFDEDKIIQERIEHQKQVASDVRDAVSALTYGWHPNDIYLMGGAPRNWDLGVPARDLDFFLTAPISDNAALEQLLTRLVPGRFVSSAYIDDQVTAGGYVGNGSRRAVFNFEVAGEAVQLLVNKSDFPAFEEWRTFPCTQSMVKWDFDEQRVVPLFARREGDIAHYFRFEDEVSPKDNELAYFEKLRKYFPSQEYKILSGKQNLPYLLFQHYRAEDSASRPKKARERHRDLMEQVADLRRMQIAAEWQQLAPQWGRADFNLGG